MTFDDAETLALRALAHILGDAAHLRRFLALSGLRPDAVRANPSDPQLLTGVLDYLLANERDLIAFCDEANVAPDLPAQARAALA